jgi:hypothetical protein
LFALETGSLLLAQHPAMYVALCCMTSRTIWQAAVSLVGITAACSAKQQSSSQRQMMDFKGSPELCTACLA